MIGRATITLGIGPHSSSIHCPHVQVIATASTLMTFGHLLTATSLRQLYTVDAPSSIISGGSERRVDDGTRRRGGRRRRPADGRRSTHRSRLTINHPLPAPSGAACSRRSRSTIAECGTTVRHVYRPRSSVPVTI